MKTRLPSLACSSRIVMGLYDAGAIGAVASGMARLTAVASILALQ